MTAEPIIEPIPIAKARRGRPPLSEEEKQRRAAERKPATSTRRRKTATPRKAGIRSLKAELAAFLTLINQAVLMSPLGTRPMIATVDPSIPLEKLGDELDAAEIGALAAALDAQCSRSPRFRKYIEQMLGVGASGQLIGVIGIIAARRASRHGVAPPMLDAILGAQLAGVSIDLETLANMPDAPDTTPDPVTAEVAPDRDAAPFDYETVGMEP